MKTLARFAARLFFYSLLLASPLAVQAQTASTYYTAPSIAALKALTTRPTVVEVVDSNPGVFNWSTTPCAAADDIFQVTPTAGPTGCYTRMATPYTVGNTGPANAVLVTNGSKVPAFSTTLPAGVTAVASSIAPGTTTFSPNTNPGGVVYNNAGGVGVLATANNGVLCTNGSGAPSICTTLPPVNGSAVTGLDASQIADLTVGTFSALQALTTRPTTVAMAGYSAAGDGGGGTFNWFSGDSTVPDNCTVVQPTTGAAGRYKLAYSGALNVRECGAKGDGVTNDSASFTTALAASGSVYAPPGTYLVDGVTLGSNQTLYGVISGTTILSTKTGTPFTMAGQYSYIHDLSFVGPSLNVTGAANNGSGLIRLTVASNATVTTGDTITVGAVAGTTEANGVWTAAKVGTTFIDLQASTFTHAYVSGGIIVQKTAGWFVDISDGPTKVEHVSGLYGFNGIRLNASETSLWDTNFTLFAGGGNVYQINGGCAVYLTQPFSDHWSTSMPAAGISVPNLCDATITAANIIHSGVDLLVNPGNGQGIASLTINSSFFDTATYGVVFSPTGSGTIVRTVFNGVWASSHIQSGMSFDTTGVSTGFIDGVDINIPQTINNANNGTQLLGAGTLNVRVNGGYASNNGGTGFFVGNNVTKFFVSNYTPGAGNGVAGNTQGLTVGTGSSGYALTNVFATGNTSTQISDASNAGIISNAAPLVNTATAPAGTLTGSTLASGVHASSLTSVGTLTAGVWNATIIGSAVGGSGVNNSGTLTWGAGGTLGTGAYVMIANYALLASPIFTGTVTAPNFSMPNSGAGIFQVVGTDASGSSIAIINSWGNSSNTGVTVGTTRADGTAFSVNVSVPLTGNLPSGVGTNAFRVLGNGNGSILGSFISGGHILSSGTTPAISACGTGTPTIAGSDNFGSVVAGTVATSCVINFGVTWGAAPSCSVSSNTAIASLAVTTSTTQLTIAGTALGGDTIKWVCGSTAMLNNIPRHMFSANDNLLDIDERKRAA